uniref:Uncharacterized protein n=1 Tax=Arundo donax TaxID=35708 RepID=A0A0A9U199_ARUDO
MVSPFTANNTSYADPIVN